MARSRRDTSVGIESDLEAADFEKEGEEFQLDDFMREGHFEKRVDGHSAKKIGVVWSNLTVKGAGSTAASVKTLPDAVLGTFGPDLYHLVTRFIPWLKFGKPAPTRTLIHDFTGIVRDGEMMLVLGRPVGQRRSTDLTRLFFLLDDGDSIRQHEISHECPFRSDDLGESSGKLILHNNNH